MSASGRVVTFHTGAQVGRWLRGLRLAAGLTQTQLSEATGVSQRYISEIETGKTDLTLSRLMLLLDHLGGTLQGSAADSAQQPVSMADPDEFS